MKTFTPVSAAYAPTRIAILRGCIANDRCILKDPRTSVEGKKILRENIANYESELAELELNRPYSELRKDMTKAAYSVLTTPEYHPSL